MDSASHALLLDLAGVLLDTRPVMQEAWRKGQEAHGLGVVTSKHVDRAAPLLAQLGCPFATVRAPAGAGRAKPAPGPILLALVGLGVGSAAAVYLGEMAVDQESAARTGVGYIHAGWGYGQPTLTALDIVASPQELLQLLYSAESSESFVQGSLV